MKFKTLTRANIRNVGRHEKIQENGIEFDRLVNGDGRYRINIMVDGRRIHRLVGKESKEKNCSSQEESHSFFPRDTS